MHGIEETDQIQEELVEEMKEVQVSELSAKEIAVYHSWIHPLLLLDCNGRTIPERSRCACSPLTCISLSQEEGDKRRARIKQEFEAEDANLFDMDKNLKDLLSVRQPLKSFKV